MNFGLSEQQVAFSNTLSRFVTDRYGAHLRKSYQGEAAGYSQATWEELAGLGLIYLRQNQDDGGLGGSAADLHVAMRTLGSGLVLDPWLAALMASRLITSLGTRQQKAYWLPKLASGSATMGLALQEAGPGHPLAHVSTTAEANSQGFILNGSKKAAIAGVAEHFLVLARDKSTEGLRLFLIAGHKPGVSTRTYRAVDGSLLCDLEFSDCEVEQDAVLGDATHTLVAVEDTLAEAFIALCSEALGTMENALSNTLEHLKLRKQFGTPLASFQVLQHRMADCATDVELVKGLAVKAALLADDSESSRTQYLIAASGLKALTSRVARRVAEEMVQLHGAMGITEELWIGQAMKRLLMITLLFGDERSQTLYIETLRRGDR